MLRRFTHMKHILLLALLVIPVCGNSQQSLYPPVYGGDASDHVSDTQKCKKDDHQLACDFPNQKLIPVSPLPVLFVKPAPLELRPTYEFSYPVKIVVRTSPSAHLRISSQSDMDAVRSGPLPSDNFQGQEDFSRSTSRPAGYSGNCYSSDDTDSAGRRCGKRSAQSRPGGWQ